MELIPIHDYFGSKPPVFSRAYSQRRVCNICNLKIHNFGGIMLLPLSVDFSTTDFQCNPSQNLLLSTLTLLDLKVCYSVNGYTVNVQPSCVAVL